MTAASQGSLQRTQQACQSAGPSILLGEQVDSKPASGRLHPCAATWLLRSAERPGGRGVLPRTYSPCRGDVLHVPHLEQLGQLLHQVGLH